jgi:hypothetical protein
MKGEGSDPDKTQESRSAAGAVGWRRPETEVGVLGKN